MRDFECVSINGNQLNSDVNLPAVDDLLQRDNPESDLYFYHGDHTSAALSTGLGSSGYITYINGDATQHMQYSRTELGECVPFGEDFIHEQNTTSYYTPYTFSGKERDMETGLSYFGARYYDAGLSIWLSVDPKAHLMPGWSPYSAMFCNPINYVDPDGQIPWPVMKKWVTSTGTTIVRRIDSQYGMRTLNGRTRQHSGLDMNLGGGRQDLGVPIYATHDGVVMINKDKSDNNDAGNRIHIASEDATLKTVYMHMKDPSSLEEGAKVKEGDIIGYIGGTAKGKDNQVDANGKRIAGTDVHLHYELHQKNDKGEFAPINPINSDGTLKDPQKMLGLPSNENLPADLRDNKTNIKPKE